MFIVIYCPHVLYHNPYLYKYNFYKEYFHFGRGQLHVHGTSINAIGFPVMNNTYVIITLIIQVVFALIRLLKEIIKWFL